MQTIVVDGLRWEIEFAGFAAPLRARASARGSADVIDLHLQPWSCGRHFEALRRNLRFGAAGLELDAQGYADAVLEQVASIERDDVPPGVLRALALWWASGIEPGSEDRGAKVDEQGWISLGDGRAARLRPWTWGERLSAQRAQLRSQAPAPELRSQAPAPELRSQAPAPEGGLDFDPVGYLEAMLRVCTSELVSDAAPAPSLEQLDAGATRRLIAAISAINHPEPGSDPLDQLSPALAAATLRLCATFGWTLERVLAMPAVEVQRMLALVERVEGVGRFVPRTPTSQPRARRRPRLADHPDAVVILFDQPEEQRS